MGASARSNISTRIVVRPLRGAPRKRCESALQVLDDLGVIAHNNHAARGAGLIVTAGQAVATGPATLHAIFGDNPDCVLNGGPITSVDDKKAEQTVTRRLAGL